MMPLLTLILAAATVLAPLTRANTWVGPRPSAASLNGKVVLVDVFTFDCINCKHVVPELRSLRAKYSPAELTIVGIHSPEMPFERDRAQVIRNFALQGITWPVAIDNDLGLWNAYGIQYWPTQMIFDRSGRLRKTIIGEGQDALVASTVRDLLAH